jgi:chromosome segregation ATPase
MNKLKEEFLELLEKDKEFRYSVAGYLGLSEILKRLDRLEEGQNKLFEGQNKLFEGQNKLFESQKRIWENIEKLWEEIRLLREGQNKLWENQNRLWENQNKLWEEIKGIKEDIKILHEGQNKLWENQNKLWEEIRELREGQNKLWEEVKYLRENQEKIWREVRGLKIGLDALGKAVGRTLEDYTIAYIRLLLEEKGYQKEKINLRKETIIYNKEKIEINIFNEEPLVVGEVKTYVENIEDAKNCIEKLIEKIKIVEKVYNKKVELSIFSIANVPQNVLNILKELTEKYGIRFIYGKELKEELLI